MKSDGSTFSATSSSDYAYYDSTSDKIKISLDSGQAVATFKLRCVFASGQPQELTKDSNEFTITITGLTCQSLVTPSTSVAALSDY